VTNQSLIFAAYPEARSRLVGGYMVFYSMGSGIGAISATSIYAFLGWSGVAILGAAFSAAGVLFWWLTRHIGQPEQCVRVSDQAHQNLQGVTSGSRALISCLPLKTSLTLG
jgi:MFS family permease